MKHAANIWFEFPTGILPAKKNPQNGITLVLFGFLFPFQIVGENRIVSELNDYNVLTNKGPHDFTGNDWNSSISDSLGNQRCAVCHMSVNEKPDVLPLWNQNKSYSTDTNSSLINIKIEPLTNGLPATPDGISRLCLSCHDGTFSSSILGQNQTGSVAFHHPISVDYQSSYIANPVDLRPESFEYSTTYDPKSGIYSTSTDRTKTVASRLDANGKIQCTSCHTLHNNSESSLLFVNNRGSLLCLACHNF